MESSCTYQRPYTIYPIMYRTHAHGLGVVMSGYRVRDGQWTEIGRNSPSLPQKYYTSTNPGMSVESGDILTSRCTFNSMDRENRTVIGKTNHDEMCNFYILYSTYYQGDLVTDYCFKDADVYQWSDQFNTDDIPSDASSLDGVDGKEKVISKFNMTPQSQQYGMKRKTSRS